MRKAIYLLYYKNAVINSSISGITLVKMFTDLLRNSAV